MGGAGRWEVFSGLENIEGSRIGEDPAGNVPIGPIVFIGGRGSEGGRRQEIKGPPGFLLVGFYTSWFSTLVVH